MELGLLHKTLCEVNNAIVKLDVLLDRLPRDKGPEGTNKAELLRFTLQKLSENTISVVGVPDIPDKHQRDLLADNVAGLCREVFLNTDPSYGAQAIRSLTSFAKINVQEAG